MYVQIPRIHHVVMWTLDELQNLAYSMPSNFFFLLLIPEFLSRAAFAEAHLI